MTTDRFDLSSKTIIIAGGAGLIGEAMSHALAEHGATTIVADIDEETGRAIAADHETVRYEKRNLMDEAEVETLVAEVIEDYGALNGWVNTAYPRPDGWWKPYEDVTYEEWQDHIHKHLNTYFLGAMKASHGMIEQADPGVIVNMGSTYGIQAPNFNIYEGTDMTSPVAYAAIKGAILNLTRYLASYLGEHGIRVNAISPGGVWDNQNPAFVENYEKRVPLGRMARPEDFQGAIVYLMSNASAYMTGHNLTVDGGWTIC
jgi:NAD(P)-dependent dehydrogenase (short-subunit alcohol dehydrogenase family)